MIDIRNVSKSYGRVQVLHDVSLQVARGGVTALIGPNGAGKSTLLSIMARLATPDTGSVWLDGMAVAQTPDKVLARRLAILRQENHLVARLTVRDLVSFGRFPHSAGRLTADDQTAIDRALRFLDLTDLSDRFLDQLSGGQRQRAFVAMVLAQDTDYVLLDEPLNNLDMKHAQAMMRLLAAAAHELGKTVVVVLHDINFASCYSDRIVAMREGRIFATGSVDQIVTPQTLREVYDLQMPVHEIDGNRIALYYR